MIITRPHIVKRKNYSEYAVWAIPEQFPLLPKRIWWRFPVEYHDFITRTGTPLLAAFLLPAMTREKRLIIKAPVSPKLPAAIPAMLRSIHSEKYKSE